jgi:hypothetical protein
MLLDKNRQLLDKHSIDLDIFLELDLEDGERLEEREVHIGTRQSGRVLKYPDECIH